MMNNFKRKILSIFFTMTILISHILPNFDGVYALDNNKLPYRFTNVAIGNNDCTGDAFFNETDKLLTIKGSGNYIGKDPGVSDSYQFVSIDVEGDSTIIARLVDFDMSQAVYGQAGIFIREDNVTENADYIGVYVEPSKNQYRYAYRDNTLGKVGAASLNNLDGKSKEKYIKIEKVGTQCKLYVAEDAEFNNIVEEKSQTLTTESNTWNVGFVVSNGGSTTSAIANFDNIIIKDSTGVIYNSNDKTELDIPELPNYNQGTLPDGFNNSSIGNNSENVYANFDIDKKQFTINGSGTYIGKDIGKTDNYQFVNYKVEGNATITARLVDFDMSQAVYGQAGIFIRENNNTDNADYFGVYVEPSKDQYRYAYRDNSKGKSGAAQIGSLTKDSKNQFIKIVKSENQFKYYISEDETFPADKTFSNTQIISNNNNTWNVGFVVSNGGSKMPAVAIFDNVKIENDSKVYYDSEVEAMPVDTVENLKAVGSDSKVTLTWDLVEEATSYIVKRATSKSGPYANIAEVNAPDTTYIDNDVVNLDTYYYKIMAKNETGVAHDSQIVAAIPNNSNSLNIQYEKNAAEFNMTKEPNDTVFNDIVTFEGSVNKDGYISIIQNGEIKVKSMKKMANEDFAQRLTLDPGRNTIEIYHTTEDGKNTIKSYNIVYLATTSYDKIVDSNYTGIDGEMVDGIRTYKTIASAIKSISDKNKERIIVFVKNGIYKEKLIVEAPYVSIIGEDSKKTILTYDDANGTINPETGIKYGTAKSASVTIKKKSVGFTAENITIENGFKETGANDEQAVALNNQADQSIFVNCRFIGNQDTLLADADKSSPARQYYYKCYIEGDVDFIFGRAQAVFNDCDIASCNRNSTTNNGYITAADTWDRDKYGYLIINSRLIGLNNIEKNTVSLGRPWRPSSQTEPMTPAVAYINCYMGEHITTKGWDDMGTNSLASTSRFYEYGSYGPGAKLSDTRNVLNNNEAINYTINKVFSTNAATKIDGNDGYTFDWLPTETSSNVNINSWYEDCSKVEKLELNASELYINVNESFKLTATITSDDINNKTVIFESSDESVATVDEDGNINALKVGSAIITARSGNKQSACKVVVTYKQIDINRIPVINAEDILLTVGDEFNPLDKVSASDYEDRDLTKSIEIIENTVDTSKAGEYIVIYKVTDSQGASAIKEIKVIVKEDINNPNEETDDSEEDINNSDEGTVDSEEDINNPDEENDDSEEDINNSDIDTGEENIFDNTSPQTGEAGIIGFLILIIISLLGIFIVNRKK